LQWFEIDETGWLREGGVPDLVLFWFYERGYKFINSEEECKRKLYAKNAAIGCLRKQQPSEGDFVMSKTGMKNCIPNPPISSKNV
jgi:hypothetical protein